MHRLVIALTTLLSLTAAAVVGGYLLFFSAATDRAATFVAADSVAYVNVYLEPSTGQRMNLASVLGHFPGFGDAATLDDKVDEAVQRFLGDAGIDYRADVKPWLGGQVAIAVGSATDAAEAPPLVLLAAVKDPALAEEALARLAARNGTQATTETYEGDTLHISEDGSTYAIADEMAIFAQTADAVRDALDRHASGATLADDAAFRNALGTLPADHLASIYLNIERAASIAGAPAGEMAGMSVASAALLAEPKGMHLVGSAPFDADASGAARATFALLSEPSSLTDWMPADTQAAAVIFSLRDILESLEDAAGSTPEVSQALVQLRALAALGLGIDIDNDLLPLLDREAAVGITSLNDGAGGVLILRPSDPQGAASTLERVADSLESRGSERTDTESQGETITTLGVPQLGSVSFAIAEGVVLLALDPDDIDAALAAHASGRTLAASEAYRSTFDLAGERAGNEIYLDVGSILDAAGALVELDAETRAILEPIRTFGLSAPAREDRLQFNAMVTVE